MVVQKKIIISLTLILASVLGAGLACIPAPSEDTSASVSPAHEEIDVVASGEDSTEELMAQIPEGKGAIKILADDIRSIPSGLVVGDLVDFVAVVVRKNESVEPVEEEPVVVTFLQGAELLEVGEASEGITVAATPNEAMMLATVQLKTKWIISARNEADTSTLPTPLETSLHSVFAESEILGFVERRQREDSHSR